MATAEAQGPRPRIRRHGRGDRHGGHAARRRRPRVRPTERLACGVRVRAGDGPARADAGRDDLRGSRCGVRRDEPGAGGPPVRSRRPGYEAARLRRLRLVRNRGGPARRLSRRSRHGGVQREERRARALPRRRRGHRLRARGLHERTGRPTTSSSTRSGSTRSSARAAHSSRAASTSPPTASTTSRSPS